MQQKCILLSLLIAFFGAGMPCMAQTPAIVSQSPCPFTTFQAQAAFVKRYYTQSEYDAAKNSRIIECFRIQYLSDGLKVVGFLVKPRTMQDKRYPVIIYNRGGLLDVGKIDASNILELLSASLRRIHHSGLTVAGK
ncbi:MAG TPA: hypothetical protein VGK48_19340 [Terriglobia bacterium]|jgi:hypothetical protein